MAYLGLRVGEVVGIRRSDISFKKNSIRIETEKAKTIDYLSMPEQVRKLLRSLVRKLPEGIAPEDNYLFPSEMPNRKHISKHWLPRVFRATCELAGLNETYGFAEDINNLAMKGSERKLYRLTTHSLRHYFITKIYNSCKDPIKTQKLARHCEFKSTQTYIHQNQDELDETIQKVFGNKVNSQGKDDVKEMLAFFKIYKEMKNG